MKQFLVICAFVAVGYSLPYYPVPSYQPAPLNADGTVADTPEVAVAKAAHYAELAKAGGAVPHYTGQWVRAYTPVPTAYVQPAYYWYAQAPAPLNADGTVAETPEVQQAKQVHFAAHAQARANLGLPVADTPEVEAAKAAHFAAHQAALSRSKRWVPAPLNPDGTVADTPEVAAAKVQHFAEVAKARGYTGVTVVPQYAVGKWWGAPAPLNPDGTVADTPAVQAAKAVHFAAHAGVRLGAPVYQPVFFGYAPLNADGTVAETPEVVARKVEHFAAYNQALARHG